MTHGIKLESPSGDVRIWVSPIKKTWRLEVYDLEYEGRTAKDLAEKMAEVAQEVGGVASDELSFLGKTLEG